MNSIIHSFKVIGLGCAVYIFFDVLWIGFFMNQAYKNNLGAISRTINGSMRPNLGASLLVWFLIVLGAYLFVLPRIETSPIVIQLIWGGIYGLILYGVYDFTNFAVLSVWPLSITLIDLGWGIFVNAIFAVVFNYINNFFK